MDGAESLSIAQARERLKERLNHIADSQIDYTKLFFSK